MIKLVSMQIAIISYKFESEAVKFVKIFILKYFKINFNTMPETIVLGVCDCVLMKLVYCILFKDIMVSYLNIYAIIKEFF